MITLKKRLATVLILAFLSTAVIVSCGKQGASEATTEEAADEHPADAEHPSDSTEHPAEHPADSTQNQ